MTMLVPCMIHVYACSSDSPAIYIYSIRNTANDRGYIGATIDMDRRYKQHKRKPPTRMGPDASLYKPFDD